MRSSKDAGQKPGPQLAGVIGRPVAGDPAFDYSPVLRAARDKGEVWTKDKLDLLPQRSRGGVRRHLDGQPADPRREAARRHPVCSGRAVG